MNNPLVSVVLPTYNRASLLPRAIESVVRQSFCDWEIVVVDDGSTDDTQELLSDYGRRLGERWVSIRQENRGSSAARNRGIDACRGRYVAFLDSDDEFAPTKLQRQLEVFELRPEIGFVYSDYSILDRGGANHASVFDAKFPLARTVPCESIGAGLYRCKGSLFDTLLRGYFIATIVGMVRREVLGDWLRFDEQRRYAEEWLFFLEVARSTPAGFVDEPLSIHHYTEGSLARSNVYRNLLESRELLHSILRRFADLDRGQRSIVRRQLAQACRRLGFAARRRGRARDALAFFAEAARRRPSLGALSEFLRCFASSPLRSMFQPAPSADLVQPATPAVR